MSRSWRRERTPRPRLRSPGIVVLVAILAACGGDGRTTLTVSAAASLAEAFGEIETAFEADHPDVDVILNLGGSATLREQILAGAPVSVFASADLETVSDFVEEGRFERWVVFASNRLTIGVPAGNPAGITSLRDLARPDLAVGLCAPEVPCGRVARRVLDAAGVDVRPVTEELDVRALVTKLEAGELDAGLVYRTDVPAAAIDEVPLPTGLPADTEYVIGVISGGPESELAGRFVRFVRSRDGERILERHGFGR